MTMSGVSRTAWATRLLPWANFFNPKYLLVLRAVRLGGPFFVQNRKHPCSKCNPVSANMGLVLHCSMPMYGSQETQ
jgi:hypothetical protein